MWLYEGCPLLCANGFQELYGTAPVQMKWPSSSSLSSAGTVWSRSVEFDLHLHSCMQAHSSKAFNYLLMEKASLRLVAPEAVVYIEC